MKTKTGNLIKENGKKTTNMKTKQKNSKTKTTITETKNP